MTTRPVVGVVVLDYNGGARTLDCIERLHRSTYPADRLRIVLVDNASTDPVTGKVAARWPSVEIVETGENVGFGGGCNAGMRLLLDGDRSVDHIALVNNDALPDPGWLEPLVDALEADPAVGAACPKVLLMGRFAEVTIISDTSRAGGGDPRQLGVQVAGVKVNGIDATPDTQFVSGFWGWEHDDVMVGGGFRWTTGNARLLVPAPIRNTTVELSLACGLGARDVRVRFGEREFRESVAETPSTVAFAGAGPGVDIVNNAGAMLQPDGTAVDRGFLEPDGPEFAEPVDVPGWSGAAVLLRASYVRELGGFDDRLFLYYEDTDMAWRGRRAGWRYRYVPASVVRHEHSATTGSAVALVHHLSRRNRLVVLTKNASVGVAARAVGELGRDLATAAWRDVVRPAAEGKKPKTANVKALARVAGGYARLAPHALRQRLGR